MKYSLCIFDADHVNTEKMVNQNFVFDSYVDFARLSKDMDQC